MKIRDYVFGSASEKELFNTLNSQWSKKFDLYPCLPFAAIITFAKANLTRAEKDFLFKTSVDYTLCTKQGRPIMSIEFDGLGHGFSKKGAYVRLRFSRDSNRKLKLDLKLRVCQETNYPLFVVSYDEKFPIGENTSLTIVDGIIGQSLAKKHFHSKIDEVVEEHRNIFEGLPEYEQHEYIQDLVIGLEVESELMWDPISLNASQFEAAAMKKGLYKGLSIEYLHDPELPSGEPFDLEVIKRRIEAFKYTRRMGCKATVKTPQGDFSETAWVRNFEGYGVFPGTIAENIARLILFKNLLSGAYADSEYKT